MVFVAVLAAGSCGDGSDGGGVGKSLVVRIRLPDGVTPVQARAVVTRPDGERAVVTNDQGGGWASFVDGDLVLDDVPDWVDVTVKVPGTLFETRRIETVGLPEQDGKLVHEWKLTALDPALCTDDDCTGFAPGGDVGAYEDLAASFSTDLGPAYTVKFTVYPLAPEPVVYFQNTKRHPLHYPFVHDVLGVPWSLPEFEQRTYHGQDRQAMAGTLLYYPNLSTTDQDGAALQAPVVVTFFPNDDLTPDQAMAAHRWLEERMGFANLSGPARRLVYLPAGEDQEAQALAAADEFATRDVWFVTREALYGNVTLQVLNPGLAYGKLRVMTPEELATAVVSFTDILVLTRLPNSLPIVGGTITEELQTPLAHVNVAARNRGTPNIAWKGASTDPRVKDLIGKTVRFEVKGGSFELREATLEEAKKFWDSHAPEPVVLEYDVDSTGLPLFADVGFKDSKFLGVKAANLAEATHVIPDQTPRGFAVPFHYYDELMKHGEVTAARCDAARADCVDEGREAAVCDQARSLCLPGGVSTEVLWDHVARLMDDATFQQDSVVREACLDSVRYLIHHVPVDPAFGAALDARVAEVFGDAKVRLRSSTNAEDLQHFSGAGLYTSVSAYASGSKAASSRVRKVWASAWNWSAFEERSFWGIDHLSVRVGVAVATSFPDEAANGVLITQNIADPTVAGMYVNVQQGEVSVTNPEGGELPEVFSMVPGPDGTIQVARQRWSSLSPGVPILTEAEISALFLAADRLQQHFASLYGESPDSLALDLEFKFANPDRALFIKQVRPYYQGKTP